MTVTDRARHFFAGGNAAKGFVSFMDSSLQGLDRVYLLTGGPGTGQSTLMKTAGARLAEQGYEIWFLHCASDPDSLEGMVAPGLGIGIVDASSSHTIEPKLPGAVEQYVHLGDAWDAALLAGQREDIARLFRLIRNAREQAHAELAEALRIHDEWEALYIPRIDKAAAERLTRRLLRELFGEGGPERARAARVDHRFLGAATPLGAVDFIPNLTDGLARRFFLKGRPGTGKSTLLKRIAQHAVELGYDTEVYHCGFDPDSLDMVVVREKGFAVFDSTAPHEYVPDRPGDEIVDLYEACIGPGFDEAHAEAIRDVAARYSARMKRAISLLAEARAHEQQLERIYSSAMNFRLVDRMRKKIMDEISGVIPIGD